MICGGDNGLNLDLREIMSPSWFSSYILYGGSVVLMVAQFKVFKLVLTLESQTQLTTSQHHGQKPRFKCWNKN